METAAEMARDSKPAYLPFSTLLHLTDRMVDEGMPTRIDKSYLSNQSGGVQSQILTGLRFLGLMADAGVLTDDFKRLVQADDSERKQIIGQILRQCYPQVVNLGTTNSTQLELEEAFEAMGVKGETRRKAVAFYLKAADYADIPKGKQWSLPRVSKSTRRRSPTQSQPGARGAGVAAKSAAHETNGHGQIVHLRSGGAVSVSVSVNLWDLDDDDRRYVLNLIDMVRGYGELHPSVEGDGHDPAA